MLTPDQLLSFLAVALVLTLSPGPDNLMVLSIGAARGRRQGMAFGLGCALGCLSHTLLAAIGVSALIAASPLAFTTLRVLGGAYLLWLGAQAVRSSGAATDAAAPGAAAPVPGQPALRLFFKGILANAINPKIVLFFLSFLPQFVVPAQGSAAAQTAALGLLFTAQSALLFSLFGYFSGTLGEWLLRRPRAGIWLDRAAGAVFIGLGLRLLLLR